MNKTFLGIAWFTMGALVLGLCGCSDRGGASQSGGGGEGQTSLSEYLSTDGPYTIHIRAEYNLDAATEVVSPVRRSEEPEAGELIKMLKGLKAVVFLGEIDSLSSLAPSTASTVKVTIQETGKTKARSLTIFGGDIALLEKKIRVFRVESPTAGPLLFQLLAASRVRQGEKVAVRKPLDENDPFAAG